jgi:uncharacterized membrane protein (UPF0127 family)
MAWMSMVRATALGVLISLVACAPVNAQSGASIGPDAPTEELIVETADGPVRLNVEIADDEAERNHGLMFRESLPDDRGMLFDFPERERAVFWMRNTPLSLDIIFIGPDGRIINIADHTTPYSDAPIPSAGPTRAVLEIRAGRAEALGIRPGDRVRHRILPR